jgi:protein-disulfide isomerase
MKLSVLALAAGIVTVGAIGFAAVPEAPKSKMLGNTSAPMRLELYGDFTCPHCKHLHEDILPMIIRDFVAPNKAYLVFRDYVLSGQGHEQSRPAAMFAAAAARIGQYQAAADALFKTQQSWAMTGQIWPNIKTAFTPEEQKKIQAVIQDPSIFAEVQSDIDAGNMIPVQRTPTMVIIYKGKKQPWSEWASYPLFKSYVDGLLAK